MSSKKLQVIVLAAGKGVRFRSETPKVLHRVCGVTMVERVLRVAATLKPERFIVVIGHGAEKVQAELGRVEKSGVLKGATVSTVTQVEQKGTAHAVQMAMPEVAADGEVLILTGDAPLLTAATLTGFLRYFRESGFDLTLLTTMLSDPTGYGRIVRDKRCTLASIVEESECTPEQQRIKEINSSIYLAKSNFLQAALKGIKNKNAKGEFYLTDIVQFGVESKMKVGSVTTNSPEEIRGANSRNELAELETIRRKAIVTELGVNGVSVEGVDHVFIDEDVIVESDVFLGAGTRLRGKTTVRKGAVIEGDCLIADSEIGPGTKIKLGSYIESSKIGAECSVGPFAHLRPGTILHDHVKIGNFVETKQAEFGDGAKANHLSYVGDASVGRDANIGAGTITCNYDGVKKHRTTIGEGAFIGSNTALIAPVTVGARATIGASSAISKDVPDDALALERNEQKIVPGWSKKKRS